MVKVVWWKLVCDEAICGKQFVDTHKSSRTSDLGMLEEVGVRKIFLKVGIQVGIQTQILKVAGTTGSPDFAQLAGAAKLTDRPFLKLQTFHKKALSCFCLGL